MKDLNKNEILSILRKNKSQLRKFGIVKIGLFGSYIRGENNKESDVDILIEFEVGKKTYDNFIQLAFFLEGLFQKEVDLLTIEAMSPYIKPHILREVQFEIVSE